MDIVQFDVSKFVKIAHREVQDRLHVHRERRVVDREYQALITADQGLRNTQAKIAVGSGADRATTSKKYGIGDMRLWQLTNS